MKKHSHEIQHFIMTLLKDGGVDPGNSQEAKVIFSSILSSLTWQWKSLSAN